MKNFASKLLLPAVLYALCIVGIFGLVPHAEAAALPATCATNPVVQGFHPYIYADGLDSFDYLVAGDGQPTAVSTVGGVALESHYTTVWPTAVGNVTKMHVDVPSWYGFSGETTIQIRVVTAEALNCVAEQVFTVTIPKHAARTIPVAVNQATPAQHPATTHKPSAPVKTPSKSGTESPGAGALVPGISRAPGGEVEFTSSCRSWSSSAWVLITILGIAALLVIIDALPTLLAGDGKKFALALLIVFLISLLLWFLFDQCRSHRWFPIVMTLLVLGTLIMPTVLTGKNGRVKKLPE